MNDTVKMFLISLITAVLVQVLLGPQIMKMQQQQGLLPTPAPVAVAPGPGQTGPAVPTPPPTVIADPSAPIPAPNLMGTVIRDARKVASAQGIVLIEEDSRDAPDAQPGEILEQNPPPGVMLTTREIRVHTAKAKEARIPNLVGKPIAEARQALTDMGAEFTEVQKDSSKTPGTVLAQKPLPNVKLVPGTSVELTIANLPLIEVPALTGKYLNSAKTALKDMGLELGDIRRTEHEEHGENYVLRQDPPAGTKVPFGTVVNLTVVAPN
jgi:beta-lactam-binding protein with PASTA domain